MAEAIGEVVDDDGVLVIRKITVRYRLRIPAEARAEAKRVHGFHARFCPVARSISPAIEVATTLELV